MKNLQRLYRHILSTGNLIEDDRTGVGTLSIFGTQLRWDLSEGFPAVTTKKLAWKAVVGELLWFLSGSTNLMDLKISTHGNLEQRTIWDDNYNHQAKALGYEGGYLGPIYGKQWRDFGGVDQIEILIKSIRAQKEAGTHNRRLLVSAWNPVDLPKMALPPCHYSFQLYLHNNKLSLLWNQRSVDAFLGLSFNIASYALLLHILANITDCEVGELIFNGGDTHIYLNHLDQVGEQIARDPRPLPTLILPKHDSLSKYLYHTTTKDYILEGYDPHPTIKAPMAI